jgi:hypothetical protein
MQYNERKGIFLQIALDPRKYADFRRPVSKRGLNRLSTKQLVAAFNRYKAQQNASYSQRLKNYINNLDQAYSQPATRPLKRVESLAEEWGIA